MMAGGVPAGAMRPLQELTSKPASPDSISVGTSGSCGRRCVPATASARSLGFLAWGMAESEVTKLMDTSPESNAFMAGAVPL